MTSELKSVIDADEKILKNRGKVRNKRYFEIIECRLCSFVFLSPFRHITKNFYESGEMDEHKPVKEFTGFLRRVIII